LQFLGDSFDPWDLIEMQQMKRVFSNDLISLTFFQVI